MSDVWVSLMDSIFQIFAKQTNECFGKSNELAKTSAKHAVFAV